MFLFLSFSVITFSVVFIRSVDDLFLVILLWLGVLGITLLVGIIETIYGYHLPLSRFYQTQKEFYLFTPTAVFYNPNNFATFLSLSAPFGLSYFLFSKKMLYRLLSLVSFFASLYMMVETGSRANMLAILLVIVFFIVVASLSRKHRTELILLISGSLLLILVFQERIFNEFSILLTTFRSLPENIGNPTTSIGVRINLIRNGFSFIKSTWGFGVGAGNFESWMQSRAMFSTGYIISSHNWFLEVLVNYGALIFIGYVVFYCGMIVRIFQVLKTHWEDQTMKMIGIGILGSLVGFLIASMSPSSIMAFRPHWLIFAFGLSYINLGLNQARKEVEGRI
jgi:teichuronic acid biosynthesis protein TuaE